MDYEFLLYDRLEVIRKTIEKYGEDNFYISFSGGKDSTVLHHLIDMAIPDNKIPRVYVNTGIEYQSIVKFVEELAKEDDRIVILKPTRNIKKTLEEYGYPFKSKEHSLRVEQFNHNKNANYIVKYINGYDKNGKPSHFVCPKKLLYQFNARVKYNYSNKCCYKLKKAPFHDYQKLTNRNISITGMRAEEGGNRARLGCVINDKKGNLIKFHPLIKVSDDWEEWFIKTYNIKLCELYKPPYNFDRTGCKGCPYNIYLQRELETLQRYFPNERKQCELIWKPVYEEYRRIGYRLNKEERIKLF